MGGEGEGGGMEPLIPAERIRNRVRELADEIERAHPAGQEIHLVGVLKGGFMFMADLIRHMSARVTLDFIAAHPIGSNAHV